MTAVRCVPIVVLALFGGACRGSNPEYGTSLRASVDGGDAGRGRAVIVDKGCGSCHTLPGIAGAHGLVGPPLSWFSRRTYIAGELPNTPENLVHWVQAPKSVEPNTAMPTLGLNDQQARDVAAYLYTLR
jgi:cytochrome c2